MKPVTPIRPPRNSKMVAVKDVLPMRGISLVTAPRSGFVGPLIMNPRKNTANPA